MLWVAAIGVQPFCRSLEFDMDKFAAYTVGTLYLNSVNELCIVIQHDDKSMQVYNLVGKFATYSIPLIDSTDSKNWYRPWIYSINGWKLVVAGANNE